MTNNRRVPGRKQSPTTATQSELRPTRGLREALHRLSRLTTGPIKTRYSNAPSLLSHPPHGTWEPPALLDYLSHQSRAVRRRTLRRFQSRRQNTGIQIKSGREVQLRIEVKITWEKLRNTSECGQNYSSSHFQSVFKNEDENVLWMRSSCCGS